MGAGDPTRKPSILVIGFPKSGTWTIQRALTEAGLTAAHWKWNGQPVGRLVYDGWYDHGDPLFHFHGLDAITQLDFCRPKTMLNVWPNLDLPLLMEIHARYPGVRLILNRRDPALVADSFARWYDLKGRVTKSDCPGLPRGRGKRMDELVRWFDTQNRAAERIFHGDPRFLSVDITSDGARERLAAFLSIDLPWWGTANRNDGIRGRKPSAAE